ncbi:MAG TPA: DJ-1/PfpI family protein, partial [Deinococcales bacterium]|nr:DJ-1/PfpI family protein [Deinococcales bacterium]
MKVAVLLFHDTAEFDLAVPYGVFSAAARRVPLPSEVFTVGKSPAATLLTAAGLRVAPNYSLGNAPEYDVLVIPGGAGAQRFAGDPVVRDLVERAARKGTYIVTIGSGAVLLGEAGLLEGAPVPAGSDRGQALARYRPGEVLDEPVVRPNPRTYLAASTLASISA